MFASRIVRKVDLGEGAWCEVRLPSYLVLQKCRRDEGDFDWQRLFLHCITSWSADDPVSPELIADLTPDAVTAIMNVLSPVKTEEEGKVG